MLQWKSLKLKCSTAFILFYLQSIPKLFIVHAEQCMFWHWPGHKYPFITLEEKTSYKPPVHRAFICLFLYQALKRAALHHPLCPRMYVLYVIVVQQERLQAGFNRGMGKAVTTVLMVTAELSVCLASFTVISLMAVSQQLNCRYNPF